MKTFFEHIEQIQGKPHHVRKRIAFTTAAGGAALVALVWFVGKVSLGVFALTGSSFVDSVGQSPVLTTDNSNASAALAGVAAASSNGSIHTAAHIEIVDAASSTSSGKKAEQTTLPF